MGRKIVDRKELLINALNAAKEAAPEGILKSSALSVATRRRLQESGWLHEICKGWYCLGTPLGPTGASERWYSHFWIFVKCYLKERFGSDYCLCAESSLERHIECTTVPDQITVYTRGPSWQILNLPEKTSIVMQPNDNYFPEDVIVADGINILPIHTALARLSPTFFKFRSSDLQIALLSIQDVSLLSRALLSTKSKANAERIAGAYEFLNEPKKAKDIVENFKMTGVSISAQNPFKRETQPIISSGGLFHPHKIRLISLWQSMRNDVFGLKPEPHEKLYTESMIEDLVHEIFKKDAYNSLSIEGYQVTLDLIERIAAGKWEPDEDPTDKQQIDALAALGYHNCFLSVVEIIKNVVSKKSDAAAAIDSSYQDWYRSLFSPSIQAGLLKPSDLVGFRNVPIYIRGSRHVPPRYESIPTCMETFFELLHDEHDPFVRAILGHFFFVYIHPFTDGNGRIARFILNAFLVSNSYNWTIVRTEKREQYMATLEIASTQHNIIPFTKFIIGELNCSC